MKKNTVLISALVLAIGAFLSKVVGAIYRVPLTNLLGGSGIGLYQMVFPVYCVMLDFAGAGVPNAISKLIAENGNQNEFYSHNLVKSSLKLLCLLGAVASLLMAVLSIPLATLQGNKKAYLGYLFLSPAVLLVSVLSVYRGYFQGKMKMYPTAISQVIEQVVKAVVGLFLVYIFLPNIPLGVGGATLAVSIAELVAFSFLFFLYKKEKPKNFVYDNSLFLPQAKLIAKYTIPITLVGIMLPLSQVVDSFLIVNILSTYRQDATLLYGLLTGSAMTVINLPVSLCYGLATVSVPKVAEVKTSQSQNKRGKKIMFLTALFSLPAMVLCLVFSSNFVSFLFRGLSVTEKQITSNLIKILSPTIFLLSILQTQNAVLIGKGKMYAPLLSMGIGIGVKIALMVCLLPVAKLNVYGGALSINACYLVAVLINLLLIFNKGKQKNEDTKVTNRLQPNI